MQNIIPYIKAPQTARLLWALSDGRAYTLIELADYAEMEREEAKDVLESLRSNQYIMTERHRFFYYKLSNLEACAILCKALEEKMEGVPRIYPKEKKLPELKYCRSCHGHLAGKVGVAVTDSMQRLDFFHLERNGKGGAFILTTKGECFFEGIGLNVKELRMKSGKFAKACLDFSERKHHLGGRLGVAFLEKMIAEGWIFREENSRVKTVTKKGERWLNEKLGVTLLRDDLT